MPDWRPEVAARVAPLQLDPAREAEIVEELSLHLEARYEELRAAGSEPDEARRLAVRELADPGRLAAEMRPLRQAAAPEPVTPGAPPRRLLRDLWQDLQYGTRSLRKRPGYTASAVLTLALGIGANTAIFSLVNATLLARLPVHDLDTLVFVRPEALGSALAYPEYAELRDHNTVLSGLAAWGGITASLNADGQTDLVGGVIVSGNYFELLGVRAALGRVLGVSDDVTPGAHPVAVISHGLWQRRFGGRPDIVGHQVLLNGRSFTIVGVTPEAFTGAQLGVRRDLYVPMMMQALIRPPRAGYSGEMDPDLLGVRTNRWLFLAGRLKAGVSPQQAQAALSPLATRLARAAQPDSSERPMVVTPASIGDPNLRAQVTSVATLLMAVVGAVLLIACANVANLTLARASARRREIAVRLAIGASRWRLVRQLLTESVLMSLLGGLAGLLLAGWTIQAWRASPPPPGSLPIAVDFTLDARVFVFTLLLSVATGILFGLAPALRASRADLVPALKDESFVPDERSRRFNLRKALVVAQIGLSLALLIAAGLFLRSLRQTQAVQPGLDADRLLIAPLQVNLLRYTRPQGRDFYRRVVEQVEALPGVESATVARIVPLSGAGSVRGLQIEGRTESRDQSQTEGGGATATSAERVSRNVVGPDYFGTLGIPFVAGRDFGPQDVDGGPLVVVVSETFRRMHFGDEGDSAVLGRRLSIDGPQGPWREIVGIVRDSKYLSLTEAPTPVAYVPLSQNHETGVTLLVRASVAPASLAGAVRREIQAIEPNLPVPDVRPATALIAGSLFAARMGALLLGAFAGLALLLAAIGVYGVMAFSISRRTRELGIRLALGADRRALFSLVLREGMRLVAVGVAAGMAAAAFGSRSLALFLYGVSPADAVTFTAVPVILGLVAVLACLVPARSATRVDPMVALRCE